MIRGEDASRATSGCQTRHPSPAPIGGEMTQPPQATAPLAELDGKAAFITGGGSGIGLGVAAACLGAGMRVVLADIRGDHLDAAAALLDRADRVHTLELDVCDREAF